MNLPPRIGRFTLIEAIGRSATSVVARAHDEGLDSAAVVKLIDIGDERFANRCMRELERWQGLGLGGIQKLVEIGKAHGHAWYAADPVPGTTLQAELDERRASGQRWTDKQVYQIGRKIAATLEILHGRQVVHGNIKPTNVLGRSDTDLALTDQGLVRATDSREIPTRIEALSAYRHMSPDQLQGMKPVDARSDIFQLGLILYECATLIHPFEKVELSSALLERAATIEPLERVIPGFDSKLSKAIMLCLARERDRRHPTVRDFSRAWASVTAKYESLSDVPIAAMNPDRAGAPRRTVRFSAPHQRVSGRARISQPLDASIREIKPTPRWVQLAAVGVLALAVGAGGYFIYTRETVARLEGGLEQQVGFAGTRISYRTSVACETAVRVSGEGTQARSFKNPKDGVSLKHTVMIAELTPGRKYLAAVEFGDGPPSENIVLAAPAVRPFARIRMEPRGDGSLALSFTTPVKARSTAHARVDGHDTDLTLSAEPDITHEGVFERASPARLSGFSIEATDVVGVQKSSSAAQLADQTTAPLLEAVTTGALAGSRLADAAETMGQLDLGPVLADLAALDAWLVESPELSDERRRAVYRGVNGLERALARSGRPVAGELAVLKPLLDSPHLRGQVITTGELARACEGAGKVPATSPVALLVQLGVFSRLKPGVFTSLAAKTRVTYDPKPQFADAVGKNVAVLRLPAPPAGEYRSGLLAVAVSALPRDGLLVATPRGEPGEFVLYSPVARPAPPPGEQWIARRLPPRAFEGGAAEISVSLEPVGAAQPAGIKVLGALLVYR